jgi:hypothetical protein
MDRVTGFLTALFSEELPGGKWKHGLNPSDFEMVLSGYACGQCLATFDRFTLLCPICKTWHDVGSSPMETPQLWLDHLAERNAPVPVEKPALSFDAAMARVMQDPEVEQINIAERTKNTRRK